MPPPVPDSFPATESHATTSATPLMSDHAHPCGQSSAFASFSVSDTFVMSFEDIRNSKMFTALGLFFLASVVSGNMQKTGAFEVWHNSVEFFSRKKTGGIPDMAVIVASLGDAIKVAKLAAASAKSMGLDNI